MKDYSFRLMINFRSARFRTVALATHFMSGLIRRALRLPGFSHVSVDITLAERR